MRSRAWLGAAATGVLLLLSFQPIGQGWLAWLAFIPLWWSVLDAPDARSAANLGAMAGLIFYGASLHWLAKVFGPFVVSFWCVFALWMALHCALLWGLWRRLGPSWLWALAVAAAWTGIEYFRSELWWLRNAWLALGYSQVGYPWLLQSCSLFGVYGLSALIAFGNAALLLWLKGRRAAALAAACAVLLLAGWGAWRVGHLQTRTGAPLPVAAVQDENYDLAGLVRLSRRPEAAKARLLVWPEYGFTVQPGQEELYLRLLRDRLAGLPSVKVVAAAIFPEDTKKGWMQNFVWILSPEGTLLGRYDKHHPIQYVERRLKPDPEVRPVDTPLGRLGVQICYDLDYEDGARRLVRQGAQLIAVPNLDPSGWKRWQHSQHSAMAPVRAVESGLWIVRAASSGFSQIIDPLGRVQAALDHMKSDVLTGDVYLREPGTVYSAWGWLLAPAAFAATLIGLLAASVMAFSRRMVL
ncbi:MAG: hypothetical protein NTY77_04005 [Elusimicrobia bacterium]|nr:hypothetical protein [Elusimicrobiota bacterium]